MVNKLITFVTLFMFTFVTAQDFIKVEIKLDSFTELIKSKDRKIQALQYSNNELQDSLRSILGTSKTLSDSLQYYYWFHTKVHQRLSPRLIARIKEDEQN